MQPANNDYTVPQSPGNQGDSLLIMSLQQGNQEALANLYDQYGPALFGFISRIVDETSIAEDILQKTFVTIWSGISTYNPSKERFIAWMLKTTMHIAIEAMPDPQGTGDMPVALKEPGVKYLSDAITLVFFKGLKLEEASRKLDIPLNTLIPTMKMAFKQLNGELPL